MNVVNISEKLFNYRMANNISQTDIAKKSGCSRATVWKFENQPLEINLTVNNLNRLINAYGFKAELELVEIASERKV